MSHCYNCGVCVPCSDCNDKLSLSGWWLIGAVFIAMLVGIALGQIIKF